MKKMSIKNQYNKNESSQIKDKYLISFMFNVVKSEIIIMGPVLFFNIDAILCA